MKEKPLYEKHPSIAQTGETVLRGMAVDVPVSEISSAKIQSILKRMLKILHETKDGVALAAPQIGVLLKIFVISGTRIDKTHAPDMVFINPKIIKKSHKKELLVEGCLSVAGLYGHIYRSNKATVKAHDEHGKKITRGGSGLLAQIFQHEIDHLHGILFTDKVEDIVQQNKTPNIVFFGSMDFSVAVLESSGVLPDLIVTVAPKPQGRKREPIPNAVEMWALERDIPIAHSLPNYVDDESVFIIAGYGKILKKKILDLPKYGVLNVHPSLLPRHRGPSPIQQTILDGDVETGVSIILTDDEIDHGPIISRCTHQVSKDDTFKTMEDKLGRLGGTLLADTLPKWINGEIKPQEQNHKKATFTRMIKKEDGLVNIKEDAPKLIDGKLRAYSEWPIIYFEIMRRKKIFRVQITKGHVSDGKFVIDEVKPEGKREMSYDAFLRGNQQSNAEQRRSQ